MCYVYELNKTKYIFIHIPKSCGRHIRETIRKQMPKIIFNGWDVHKGFDKAHVPRCMLFRYIKNIAVYNMYTYVRNPYDRAISTYGHMYQKLKKSPEGFAQFVKTQLNAMVFAPEYTASIIHAYPQYMFLTDMRGEVDPKIDIRKIEDYEDPPVYDRNVYYSDVQVRQIVERIYARDFELFGYPLMDETQLETPIAPIAPTTPVASIPNKPRRIPRCYFPHPNPINKK